MRKLLLVGVALALLAPAGCCRMCCWQRGGSFYNGYCYPAMPPLQQVPQAQPTQTYAAPYAQPCSCQ
jgi:hypothetical protein